MWKTMKLGELLEVQNGYAFNSKKFNPQDGMPLIRIRDLKNGLITKTYFTGEYEKKYIVHSGDFLIGMDGEFCCYQWKGKDALLNQRVCRLQNFTQKLNPKFLHYIINKELKLIEDKTGFTTVKHLSSNTIKEIQISIPTIQDQERIVAKLDSVFAEVDKIINLTAEKIVKEKDLNLSSLKSTFSTIKSKKTIGEIATVIAGQSPEGKYYNRNANGTPFYQGKKEFGDYELKKPTFWTTKITKEALKGDVLLSVRAPVGETNMSNDKICIGRGLAAIRASKDNNSEFIYYFLNSIKKQIVGNTGAVFNSINKKQIEDIVIPIQGLDEQNKTVNKIKLILSHMKTIHLYTKQKLHNLNILKLSILKYELKNRT